MEKQFEPVIGMEVHIELSTTTKMFCSCSADHFEKSPNSQVCPVCLGLPGALPVPNREAIRRTQLIGVSLGCQLALYSKFDRKNYFYPDLPKGYQISQFDLPLCQKGLVTLESGKVIRIRRIHLEEDTAKNIHTPDGTLINFNRSGVPLVEIVTEPDLNSSEETSLFLRKLVGIIARLGVSSCDMEKGTLRLEANISLRPKGSKDLPNYKVEVKNVNSFRYIGKAIDFEIKRHEALLRAGKIPDQETRGFDENMGETISQRGKEEAHDYRYFPEPDIPPLRFSEKEISDLKLSVPELPDKVVARLTKLGLPTHYTQTIAQSPYLLSKFDQICQIGGKVGIPPLTIANALVNKRINPDQNPEEILKKLERPEQKIDETVLSAVVDQVVAENAQAVLSFKSGKTQALGFLIGLVVKKVPNQTSIPQIKEALLEKLNQDK